MTTKTLPAKVTFSAGDKAGGSATAAGAKPTNAAYTALLRRARTLFATDVETRFEIAGIFSKMLKIKTAAEVAEDTDMTPGGVERIARVGEFWGDVRIKADGAGKRPAPWFTYDRVALDPVIPLEKKELIKRAAPQGGLSIVRKMIDAARRPEVARVEEIVRGKRAAMVTDVKPHRRPTSDATGPVSTFDIGAEYVRQALESLGEAIENLDHLEALSQDDAVVVQDKLSDLMKQYVRLTKVK